MRIELACWDVTVQWKEMDMSGGDNVDGPRWTGGWVDVSNTLAIVAQTRALAEAAAVSLFYDSQKASVKSAEKVRDVHAIVGVTKDR